MNSRRGLGWVPDVPKHKDYDPFHPVVALALAKAYPKLGPQLEQLTKGAEPVALPRTVDLRRWFQEVDEQASLNCCTAHTTVALVEYFERRVTGRHVDASILFVYKVARNLANTTGNVGVPLRTGLATLALCGAPPEKFWPYVPEKFDLEPPAFVYALGQNYKAVKYFRLDPGARSAEQVLQSVKVCLANELPSMFGFPVFEEYQTLDAQNNVRLPAPSSIYSGGHANVAVGYDDDREIEGVKGALLVRNSFGPDWGENGYAWMPYSYVTTGLTADWWTLVNLDWVDLHPLEDVVGEDTPGTP